MTEFDHDPREHLAIDPGEGMTFEEAQAAASLDEDMGIGYRMSRHDPNLVVELSNCTARDGDQVQLRRPARTILDGLGRTYVELEGWGVRALYIGTLPDPVHGGEPETFTIGAGDRDVGVRVYDSGWFPLSLHPLEWGTEQSREIDDDALRRFLVAGGILDE